METSFDTLFRQFYAPMVLYADSRLNDREQAEDVVQDVFSKLLETGFSTGDPAKARQYLFTVLRNKVIDIFRYNQRHQRGELCDAPSDDSVEDSLFELELYERQISEAMQLRMQGYDDHEIAQMQGINYNTVRSRIYKGVVMLRGKFNRHLLYSVFL